MGSWLEVVWGCRAIGRRSIDFNLGEHDFSPFFLFILMVLGETVSPDNLSGDIVSPKTPIHVSTMYKPHGFW